MFSDFTAVCQNFEDPNFNSFPSAIKQSSWPNTNYTVSSHQSSASPIDLNQTDLEDCQRNLFRLLLLCVNFDFHHFNC